MRERENPGSLESGLPLLISNLAVEDNVQEFVEVEDRQFAAFG